MTRGDKIFYIIFIDDYSRYSYIYLLRTKDEVKDEFKIYKIEVKNKLKKKIERLKSKRGGEYELIFLSDYCE